MDVQEQYRRRPHRHRDRDRGRRPRRGAVDAFLFGMEVCSPGPARAPHGRQL